jgi:hypothetical protein
MLLVLSALLTSCTFFHGYGVTYGYVGQEKSVSITDPSTGLIVTYSSKTDPILEAFKSGVVLGKNITKEGVAP